MAQRFLLSAASRTLSLRSIYKAGEDSAYETFYKMRWPETDGEAVCPVCSNEGAYKITTRRKFKCKNCHHQFSVTSGTIFASRKMDFVDLLAAICLIVNAAKGRRGPLLMKEGRSSRSNVSEIAEPRAFSKNGSPHEILTRIF